MKKDEGHPERRPDMTLGNELYLGLIIVAFLALISSLAYCSIDEARQRRGKDSTTSSSPD
jgi:hypothetical protein